MVVLVTGKPGAGKTHYADLLAQELSINGVPAMVFDGDAVRKETNNNDFSDEGRMKNLDKLAELALSAERNEIVAIVAAVSPKVEWRDAMRRRWKQSRLVYIPGGTLWEGTEYEIPIDREYHVYK